jgi:hypothetical protein
MKIVNFMKVIGCTMYGLTACERVYGLYAPVSVPIPVPVPMLKVPKT